MKVGDLVQLKHGTIGLLTGSSIDSSEPGRWWKVWHVLVEGAVLLKIHEVYGMIEVISEGR